MLPPSSESIFNTDEGSIIHRHEPYKIESSSCTRPQMAWQMYEQLLRIASSQQQHKQESNSKDDEEDRKRMWLAAFTGPTLAYCPGVAAGVAEPL